MRKLKLQMQMTLDGFVAGPNGEMDWMNMNWGEDIGSYVTKIMAPIDTILLGRKLAEGFIPHWAANPTQPGAEQINNCQKIVFSRSRTNSEWNNTSFTSENLTAAVSKIKNTAGGDVIAYGGGEFVSGLIEANLIDEYYLFVNPVAIGKGMTIFAALQQNRNLQLAESKPFDCGIVLLLFKPVR